MYEFQLIYLSYSLDKGFSNHYVVPGGSETCNKNTNTYADIECITNQ